MTTENTALAQRKRILNYLHAQPLDTLTARKELDVMHPAARVMELRKQGVEIKTIRINRSSDYGKIHTVACYVLGATALANKTINSEGSEQ